MMSYNWWILEPELFPYSFGEEVEINPTNRILIPAFTSVRVTIKTDFNPLMFNHSDMIFNNENLVLRKDRTWIFETNYSLDLSEILSLDYKHYIPKRLRRKYISRTSRIVHEFANELVGDEKNIAKLIFKLYEFVHKNMKPSRNSKEKKAEILVREYMENGFFSGNCREASNLFIALCQAIDLPARKVSGFNPYSLAWHRWSEVCVPTISGYAWVPVDCGKGYFKDLGIDNYFVSHICHHKLLKLVYLMKRSRKCYLKVESKT